MTTRIPAHSPVPAHKSVERITANAWTSTFPCQESIVSVCARGNSSGMPQAPLTHTVDDRHVSCLCSRWEELGVAGATLPRPHRLSRQTPTTTMLPDIQHQLQHTTRHQHPTKPIRRPRPIRHHTTRRKTPHTRLPLTPHRRHLHRTTMRSLPHPQQAIHTTSRHHTPTQPRIQTTHPTPIPPGTRLLRQRHRIHMMVIPTHHPRGRRIILLEIRRRRQHQYTIRAQILTQRTRHPRHPALGRQGTGGAPPRCHEA